MHTVSFVYTLLLEVLAAPVKPGVVPCNCGDCYDREDKRGDPEARPAYHETEPMISHGSRINALGAALTAPLGSR